MKSSVIINLIAISVAVAFIGGAVLLTKKDPASKPESVNNVNIENGVQIIEIKAKGGYSPRKNIAKAGVPTIIRFKTNSTFDCSSAVSIPTLGISESLPASGSTDIDIGTPEVSNLKVICSMGMYSFSIDFQS